MKPTRPIEARELLVALACALVLFAWPVRGGLFNPDRVVFGVDNATALSPWNEVIESDPELAGVRRPRQPSLADQGLVFYPYYRWVAESWIAGDPPAWNPLVYAGAPGIANPQSGALDPQVWPLVVLYKLGGQKLFDWGLSAAAWLRLAAAGLGAFLLARALALERGPAALTGVTFGLAGYVLLWLNHSLGHVTPLLPWVLLGLERIRGPRPLLAAAGTSAALALAILGGHPETAFYVGATAGVWALAILVRERRAGLLGLLALAIGTVLASASLLPFVEYLQLSGAKTIRDAQLAAGGVDLVALGGLLVCVGLGTFFARLIGGESREGRPGRHAVLCAIGVALAFGGTALILRGRGLAPTAALAVIPDLFGALDSEEGYRGPGAYVEAASGWVAFVALGLALAAALSPRGPLLRRWIVVPVGGIAMLLCLEVPGILDLYRHVPLIGLGATARLGSVSALMIALLAGEALQSAPRAARIAAGVAMLLFAVGAMYDRGPEPLPPERLPIDVEDELYGILLRPGDDLADGMELEGWLHPSLPIEHGLARVQKLDARGIPIGEHCYDAPLEFTPEPSPNARRFAADRLANAPPDARFFRASYLVLGHMPDGTWRFAVDFFSADSAEQPVATRVVAVSRLHRPRGAGSATLGLVALSILALFRLPARPSRFWCAGVVALALLQGLVFARGTNPAVPRGEVFPPTKTEAVLAEILGPHRFFSDPYVMAPDTGMVRGLHALDGYDGMDVAQYNAYRFLCVPPGTNALLAWNARGVDLDGVAFRLLGVGALVTKTPLEHPGWELVAAPGVAGTREAEVFVYRAIDPLPRAFCVPQVVSNEELADASVRGAWDPLALACTDADWRPATPFTRADVTEPVWTNNTVTLSAELDGDGLLVLTDQAFPGWTVEIDGEEGEILTCNGIFRGVPLSAGEHAIEFRYEPWTLRAGTWLSGAALLLTAAFAALGIRRRAA